MSPNALFSPFAFFFFCSVLPALSLDAAALNIYVALHSNQSPRFFSELVLPALLSHLFYSG